MAKKSFWQGVKDFFKDDGPHLITDEEWEAMQAAAREQAAQDGDAAETADDLPEEVLPQSWFCPECHTRNAAPLLFCRRCGYHPGGFAGVLAQMTDEQIELVLNGSCRYPAAELRLLEKELVRRKTRGVADPSAAGLPPAAELDAAEWQRLAAQYRETPAATLYAILSDADYTPEARRAAADELARRGLSQSPAPATGEDTTPGADAAADAPQGWKCTRCGAENPPDEYFCAACGDYRY